MNFRYAVMNDDYAQQAPAAIGISKIGSPKRAMFSPTAQKAPISNRKSSRVSSVGSRMQERK